MSSRQVTVRQVSRNSNEKTTEFAALSAAVARLADHASRAGSPAWHCISGEDGVSGEGGSGGSTGHLIASPEPPSSRDRLNARVRPRRVPLRGPDARE